MALIRESGVVIETVGTSTRVRTAARAGCARCAAGEGCGAGLNAWLLSDRLDLVLCDSRDGAPAVGEAVTLEIEESAVLLAAALAYCLPLVAMVVSAASAYLWGANEVGQIIGGLAGLALGAFVAQRLAVSETIARRLVPQMKRYTEG